jgi:3-oxoacyl-[acyl-carrier protein] reductase
MNSDYRNLFDLKGRVALVTGAGQGVGRAIAQALADFGAGAIIVNDFHADRAEAVAADLQAKGVKALPLVADVADFDLVHARIAEAAASLGPIDILVNNAGNFGSTSWPSLSEFFWETSPDRWRKFIDVNLYGVMNCCHAVLPSMAARNYGRIVTITSDAARNIEARTADYGASKAGAAGFMRGLAADGARFGITANCVALATILPEQAPDDRERFLSSDRTKAQLSQYKIRRFGQPDDVVGTVIMLCSDAAEWTTGQTYPINGGYSSSQ